MVVRREEKHMYVGGSWVGGGARELRPVASKADGQTIATVPIASAEDIAATVHAANEGFEANRESTPFERYTVLQQVADALRARRDDAATCLVHDVGKTIREAESEVRSAELALRDAAEEAKRITGEIVPVAANPGSESRFAFTVFTPTGPVCAITPFNAPLNQASHKVAAAIAAGNSVVVKPNTLTPLSTCILMECIEEAGLSPGVVNMVFGDAEVGECLVGDNAFSHISFTGSAAVGQKIRAAAGLRPVTLELGSNAPTIVHEDADLRAAAAACARSGYAIAGQVCTSVQRILVHEGVAQAFSDVLIEVVSGLHLGDPFDRGTDVGPMISDEAAERAERWLKEALAGGARLLVGGDREGRWFQPTVLADVTPEMNVVCTELFAPIMSIMIYRELDEAIRMANDTPYGLQVGVFTSNVAKILDVAKKLRYGGIMINDASRYRAPNMPYGGVKDSGLGREGARFAIRGQSDMKTVVITP